MQKDSNQNNILPFL